MSNVATIPDKSRSVTVFMADRYGMEPAAFEATLRATVIKPDKSGRVPSREEFAAFLLVAKQYGLNPITKEIYAFTDKGAVVPIVSVDGWANLINSNPHFDGMDFVDATDEKGNIISITCRMYRKDRSHPTCVTEYMAECKRPTDPWGKWPRRMLRHKAMIQAARYAFGFAGIYDEDEGERIIEARTVIDPPTPPAPPVPQIEAAGPATAPANDVPPVPPMPPIPPQPPAKDEPSILDRYRAAVAAAKDGDDLDAAWNEIVGPHMDQMTRETYEAFQKIDDDRRGELDIG